MTFFVAIALSTTLLLFYLFFRSLVATLVSMTVMAVAVFWAFATIGALGYSITILTAIIPPLIIVIGVPNCIFLIHKYQQEYNKHQNKVLALSRVVAKVGATLFTNTTTAFGFFTFLFTDSKALMQFGLVASLNIMGVFALFLLLIPILYSYLPEPKERHLKYLTRLWVGRFIRGSGFLIRARRAWVYGGVFVLIALALNGLCQMRSSGNPFDDLPKDKLFYKDIQFFDAQFNGVLPLEVYLDTKRPNGVVRASTLGRMDSLSQWIAAQPGLNKPISLVGLVKFARQAF